MSRRKLVRRRDLFPTNERSFLLCDVCHSQYSDCPGDYWNTPDDYVFVCCKTPMRHVIKYTIFRDVG